MFQNDRHVSVLNQAVLAIDITDNVRRASRTPFHITSILYRQPPTSTHTSQPSQACRTTQDLYFNRYIQFLTSCNRTTDTIGIQADKAVASAGSGFGWFGSKTDKYENAVDLYTRAANAFRMQKAGTHYPSSPPQLALAPLTDEA
jgi:hypothetical protein